MLEDEASGAGGGMDWRSVGTDRGGGLEGENVPEKRTSWVGLFVVIVAIVDVEDVEEEDVAVVERCMLLATNERAST